MGSAKCRSTSRVRTRCGHDPLSNPIDREFRRQDRDRRGSNPYEPGDMVYTPYAISRAIVVHTDENAVFVKTGYLKKQRVLLDLVFEG